MISIEMLTMNITLDLITKPLPVIALFAIFGVLKLLEKQIMKQHGRYDSMDIWQEVVTAGYEVIPASTKIRSGDIKA